MLLLTSTSDLVQVVTNSAGDIEVHTSYVDNNAGTITPGRTNTANIATATTTTIVDSPGASVQRNVLNITICNNSASVSNLIDVLHTDGTNSHGIIPGGITLAPNESLVFDECGDWTYYASNGVPIITGAVSDQNYSIANAFAETMGRNMCPEVNTTIGTTGQIFCEAVFLRAGQTVSNISFCSATTAAGTPTHYVFALYSTAGSLLASSADQTSTAWAANTMKTLAMGTPYKIPTTGLYYLMISVVATTVPTIKGGTALTDGTLRNTAPALQGLTSTTYATGTAPASIAVPLTKGTTNIWGAVS